MNAKSPSLDPNLAAILASIRQTVSGTSPEPDAREAHAQAGAEPSPATPATPATPPLRRDVPPSDRTVEEFLADLIRPQVDAWLAQHLPEIVQQLAAEEIRRLTSRG